MVEALTDRRDLRGGHSLWAADASALQTRTSPRVESCDVAIVGTGISGALIGLKLSQLGLDVVFIDKRSPGRGSTIASTAMIQFEIDTPLHKLAGKIGRQRAERAYLRSASAVRSLRKLIADESLQCAWTTRDALYLAGDELGSRGLQTEAKMREKIGLPSRYIDGAELRSTYGFDRTGAIVSTLSGQLDPYELTMECLRAAKRYGARVYEGHEIDVVDTSDKGVVLCASKSGMIVNAQRTIFATGYETLEQIPKARYDVISSWAIATETISADQFWPTKCLVWEASNPYLYMRTTADGRIVVGGEDAKIEDGDQRDALIERKSRKLLAGLNRLLPDNGPFKIAYSWAGAFADSPTGLPFMGVVPGMPNCFTSLGCGGNGITFSVIAADIAAAWASGKRDRDADLFD